ncbi:MAG: SRPBCC family protein [Mycobacteriales bacterium]
MTTSGTFTTTIQAPPDRVWTWIGHLDKHAEWSPKPYQVELVSGQPDAVGSRYRSVGWIPGDKHHHNDVEITEVVPAEHLVLRASEKLGTFRNTYELRPAGGGTEVTYRLEFPPLKGMSAVMVPVLFPLVGKRDIRKRMGLLKEKAEAGV